MAVWVDERSRVIIQGVTGNVGSSFAHRMAGTWPNFVGGVTPGRGGQVVAGRPVFGSVAEAVREAGATASLVAVPAPFAGDAVVEAVEAGLGLVSVYTDLIPLHEAMRFVQYARARGTRLIGPNAAGIVSPGRGSVSELHEAILRPGPIGVVSKSGSLSYEVVAMLDDLGLGQSTVCCLGGDPVLGTDHADCLEAFERDPDTRGVVLLGEAGGLDEVAAAPRIREMSKPVVAYVAGHSAPPGKRMGHAGALVTRGRETARAKTEALAAAGARVAMTLDELPGILAAAFS